MIAKYPGTCRLCGTPIKAGEKIKWVAGKGAFHSNCPGRCESREGCIPYHEHQYDACIGCKEWGIELDADGNPHEMPTRDGTGQGSARRAEISAAEHELPNIDY